MEESAVVQTGEKKSKGFYDYSLLFLICFLVSFGLIMIYSTSSYNALKYYSDPTLYLRRQAIFAIIGIPFMIVVSKIDYHIYMRKLPIIKVRPIFIFYLMCILLLVFVTFKGDTTNGSERWIKLGSFASLQPSELTKICVILLVAHIIYIAPKRLDHIGGFLRILLFVAPVAGLVAKENLSTALVIMALMFGMSFIASKKKLYFIAFGLAAIAAAVLLIVMVDYRSDRIDIWLNIDTNEDGYQIRQALYAIASGGMFGVGLGNSMQKLGYIPEAHNDMIFSIICEELGIFGAVAILMLFLLLIWRLCVIASNAEDLYGSMIAVGVMIHISVQVIINVAVVTNSIPSTGITLPFISYGGSSLMVLLIEMGLVLSVSNRIKRERYG